MADDAGAAGGPGGASGFCRGFGSCHRRHGCGPGCGALGSKDKDKEWIPITKLGCLVKIMKIYLFSLPIKESKITDFFLGTSLKDEVLRILPVWWQTRAGQRNQGQAFVTIGNYNDFVSLVKCCKEVASAICGTIILAKLSIVPVWRSYWGNKIGKLPLFHATWHATVALCWFISSLPSRGTGIVSALMPNKSLVMNGINDCNTSARGCTAILDNFVKATFDAISKTCSYLTPDFWKEIVFTKSGIYWPSVNKHSRVSVQRTQVPAVVTT